MLTFSKAERLLEDGTAKVLAAYNHPFMVQALRHLAFFYAKVGRYDDAIERLTAAKATASKYEIQGQLQEIEDALRRLERAR